MPYCAASIARNGHMNRQLYYSVEAARDALMGEARTLRDRYPADADELNGVLDELQYANDTFFITFIVGDQEWTAWYHPLQ